MNPAESILKAHERIADSEFVRKLQTLSATAAVFVTGLTTKVAATGFAPTNQVVMGALGVAGLAGLAATMSYIHKKEHGGIFSTSKDHPIRQQIPTAEEVDRARGELAVQKAAAVAETAALEAKVNPAPETELKSYAKMTAEEQYATVLGHAKLGAAAVFGYGAYKFLSGAVDGQTFSMMAVGMGGIVAAVQGIYEMAKRYPERFSDASADTAVPSTSEIETAKADLSVQKADANADVQDLIDRLHEDLPSRKL